MGSSDNDLMDIYQIVNPLLGHAAWNVQLGIGSFVTMEFGQVIPSPEGNKRGEWYLWIYCCGWFLENPNGSFIGSEDSREVLKQEVKVLEGHTLVDLVISPTAFETKFVFDSGLVLHTFPLSFIDPCDSWKLFTPEGKVLTLKPNSDWSYEFSTK